MLLRWTPVRGLAVVRGCGHVPVGAVGDESPFAFLGSDEWLLVDPRETRQLNPPLDPSNQRIRNAVPSASSSEGLRRVARSPSELLNGSARYTGYTSCTRSASVLESGSQESPATLDVSSHCSLHRTSSPSATSWQCLNA